MITYIRPWRPCSTTITRNKIIVHLYSCIALVKLAYDNSQQRAECLHLLEKHEIPLEQHKCSDHAQLVCVVPRQIHYLSRDCFSGLHAHTE